MLCLILCVLNFVHAQTSPTVDTKVGQIRGLRMNDFIAYLGVPYGEIDEAKPFEASKPYAPFETPYHAQSNPTVCPQVRLNGTIQGDIHCLHLNIYTPIDATPNSTYPVMVYVHGGGFVEGNGNLETYSPKFLVKQDVIVITVNYRVGLYGFVCLPELGYSNEGIKDVILALKWVKDNVKSFGGDHDNILLFGHSSASTQVEFLMLYNEENVFDKVILQSAQIVCPYLITTPANADYVRSVVKKLGFEVDNDDIKDVMKKLSSVDTDTVIDATKDYVIRPCVDEVFLTRTPKKIDMKHVKIMVGTTLNESLYFYKDDQIDNIKQLKQEIDTGFEELPQNAFDEVNVFYGTDVINNIIDASSDYAFNYPSERSVRFYLDNNAVVYRYLFSYDGGRNFMKVRDGIESAGVAHGDELGYLYDMDVLGDEITEEDQQVIDIVTGLWTNFAKYGHPTAFLSPKITTNWPQYEDNTKYYMDIGATLNVKSGVFGDRIEFWEAFYKKYGGKSKGFNYGEKYVKTEKKNLSHAYELR